MSGHSYSPCGHCKGSGDSGTLTFICKFCRGSGWITSATWTLGSRLRALRLRFWGPR
jgi:DnaJ-class molecular chaperone